MTSSDCDTKRSRRGRDVFRQPTKHLRRGKACLNCRFLKIKCDGIKPTCGQCIRVPKDDPCEYTDGPSRTLLLQQNVAELQARIRELEDCNIKLIQAPTSESSSLSVSAATTPSNSTLWETSSSSGNSPIPPPPYYSPSLDPGEPSFCVTSDLGRPNAEDEFMLTEIFLPHAPQFGFFRDVDRFRASVAQRDSCKESPTTTTALIAVVVLWGAHLSGTHSSTSVRETELLRRALAYIGMQITTDLTSTQVLELLQAKVLLATYFLRKNRFTDSDYHVDGAVSLCLSSGFHKLSPLSPNCGPQSSQESIPVPPINDAADSEERINAFWTVFSLQRHLLIVRHPTSCAFGNLDSCRDIATPWPSKKEKWKLSESASLGTLKDFWTNDNGMSPSNSGGSEREMYVKAIIMLQKAVCYLSKAEDTPQSDYETTYQGCLALNEMVSNFQLSLPSHISLLRDYSLTPETDSAKRQSIQLLLTTHAIAACAQLKVHQLMKSCGLIDDVTGTPFACIDVALGILQSHYTLCISGCAHFDPVASTLCSMAYQFLLKEQVRIESQHVGFYWLERDLGLQMPMSTLTGTSHHQGGHVQPTEQQSRILVAVEESKSIMTYLSTACPCMNYEFERVSKEYDARLPKTVGFRS
ncbi:hypothetical protein PM082_000038 [Marasmius tenuissimus]|nr:hypothetical protein PM082_000038 [Marasmius tenuissimus]